MNTGNEDINIANTNIDESFKIKKDLGSSHKMIMSTKINSSAKLKASDSDVYSSNKNYQITNDSRENILTNHAQTITPVSKYKKNSEAESTNKINERLTSNNSTNINDINNTTSKINNQDKNKITIIYSPSSNLNSNNLFYNNNFKYNYNNNSNTKYSNNISKNIITTKNANKNANMSKNSAILEDKNLLNQTKVKMYLPRIIPSQTSSTTKNSDVSENKQEMFRIDTLNVISNFQPYRKLFMDVLNKPIGCSNYHLRSFNCPDLEAKLLNDMNDKFHEEYQEKIDLRRSKNKSIGSMNELNFNNIDNTELNGNSKLSSIITNRNFVYTDLKYKPIIKRKKDVLEDKNKNGPVVYPFFSLAKIKSNKGEGDFSLKKHKKLLDNRNYFNVSNNNSNAGINENKRTLTYNLDYVDRNNKKNKNIQSYSNNENHFNQNMNNNYNVNYTNKIINFEIFNNESNFNSNLNGFKKDLFK